MKKNLLIFALFGLIVLQLTSCGNKSNRNTLENIQNSENAAVESSNIEEGNTPEPVDPSAQLESSASPEDVEAIRQNALEVDKAIWSRVLSADKNYTALLDTMESADSLYSVSSFCGDLCDLMTKYSNDIADISDDKADEYIEYAGYYFAQIWSVSNNVKDYSDKMDNKYLEKATDGISAVGTLAQSTIESRFSYLSKCGYTNDEIIAIGESFSE